MRAERTTLTVADLIPCKLWPHHCSRMLPSCSIGCKYTVAKKWPESSSAVWSQLATRQSAKIALEEFLTVTLSKKTTEYPH
jgi:hypothetical protein